MAGLREPYEQTPRGGDEASSATPLFSVVIPVRNEEQHIAKCLASLQRMNFPLNLFEVIVVDNGSTDGTVAVASSFCGCLSLRIFELPDVYISALRNAGASVARGVQLAFLDADCQVRSDWLVCAARAVPCVDGVFGSFYAIPDGSSWVARYWYLDRDRKDAGHVTYLPSGDLFVSRALFQKMHGFDESIQTNEDYEFCQRVRAAGFPITCMPELAVIHWGTPQSLAAFFRKHRWHGTHVFRVFLRNLPALFNCRAIAFAFYTLFCVAGILAGAIIAVGSGHSWVLSAFLLALLLPPFLLGSRSAICSGGMAAFLPMTGLFLTYAFARASSLLQWSNWADALIERNGGARRASASQNSGQEP